MMNKMRKMKNKKGFTLMEMLIVVAIIAILIAIAIPTFANSLNKARTAVDEANIRSGYAEVMSDVLLGDYDVENGGTDAVYFLEKDGSVTKKTTTVSAATDAYKCQGAPSGDVEISGQTVTKWSKDSTVSYTYTASTGKVTISVTK